MHPSTSTSSNIFTVSKLNRLARSILESEIGQIWLSAEISNFVAAASGHWYFTLKDERAQVKAAMFKGANRRMAARPKSGDKVLVRANLSLYEPRGDYQLIVEHLEPEGLGLLKQQFEQLKIKLAAEGLFAQHYKKPLPPSVERVGVITSASGAALHDILTVLKRRNPAIQVIVYPTLVQGDAASASICQAIRTANRRNETDVLIVGRGGGSLEDLWCFNDEAVARSLFESSLPVISAVGHEVDITIADFIADMRAATPSAAAELVSDDRAQRINRLNEQQKRLFQVFRHCYAVSQHRWQLLQQRLARSHPQTRLQHQSQRLDQLSIDLKRNMVLALTNKQMRLAEHSSAIRRASPLARIVRQQDQLKLHGKRLMQSCQSLLLQRNRQLQAVSQLLNTVSPLATLSRGYSIAFKKESVIRSIDAVQTGEQIRLRVKDGEIISTVDKCEALPTSPGK